MPPRLICPDKLTGGWWRLLIRYLGGRLRSVENQKKEWHSFDCYAFVSLYNHLIPKAKTYFSDVEGGDFAKAVCAICRRDKDALWAERQLARCTVGDVPGCVWELYSAECIEYKWARRLIELARTGDPAMAVFRFSCVRADACEWAKKVISSATIGDPSNAAAHLAQRRVRNVEWAQQLISNASIGDPANAATYMVSFCGSQREWAEGVIQNARVGNVPIAAGALVRGHGSDIKWAASVIRSAISGDLSYGAYALFKHARNKNRMRYDVTAFSRAEAEHIIENDKIGDPATAACLMYELGSDLAWTKRVIENAQTGNPSSAAVLLWRLDEVDLPWTMRVITNAPVGYPAKCAVSVLSRLALSKLPKGAVEWARSVIENAATEDAVSAAYTLASTGMVSYSWADELAERRYCCW